MKGAMTNRAKTRCASTPEQAMGFLSERLRTVLALTHRCSDDLVPAVLATLPRGSHLLLFSLGALRTDPSDPSEFALTPFGRELAASCALSGLDPEVQKAQKALEEEQARRDAAGEKRDESCFPSGRRC